MTIETTIHVNPDHTAVLRVPADISPGEHHAVIVVEQNGRAVSSPRPPLDLPTHDVGPWPRGYLVNRENLYDDEP